MKPLVDAKCEWRSILGYEGAYLVSDTGVVFSEPRTEFVQSKRTGGHYRYRGSGVKKTQVNKLGYEQVGLHSGGKTKLHLVHRLVAQAFLPNPDNLPEVNHIDGNKSNNSLLNLEWSTRKNNALHGARVLCKNRGETNKASRLTEEDVRRVVTLLAEGYSQSEIAKLFNVTNHAIYRIQHGFNWAWLTGCSRKEPVCLTI